MAKRLIQDIISTKKQPSQAREEKSEKTRDDDGEKSFFIKSLEEKMGKKAEERPKKTFRIKFPRLKFPKLGFLRSGLKLKFVLGLIALGLLILGARSLLNKFSSVSVEVTPKQEFIDVDITLGASTEPKTGELGLEVMRMNYEEKEIIQPTGKKQVSKKAGGQIIIYNAYSSQPQTLIATTRFETPDGKIYRLNKSITVPGAKIEGGKITASEIEATVFADQPGIEYNIDLTDFTIPGFKDPEKREKIYGRSKTKMEGGFVGEAAVLTESDIANLKNSLKEKVRNYLLKMGVNPKPDNFLLYDEAKQIVFDEQKNGPKPGDIANQLELKESAVLFGFLLKKSDLYGALAGKYLNANDANQVEIVNVDKLSFELKNFSAKNIIFNLKGQAHFSWKIDEASLKNDLIKEKDKPDNALIKYPAITKAKIIFSPSWWSYLPEDPSRIKIIPILIGAPMRPSGTGVF